MTVILVGTESLHLSDTRTGLLVTALAVGIGVGASPPDGSRATPSRSGWFRWARRCWASPPSCWDSRIPSRPASLWLAVAGFAGGLFIVPLNAFLQEPPSPRKRAACSPPTIS